MKKTLSIVLSICMLLSLTSGLDFSAYALSSSGNCGNSVKYTFNSSTGKLTISGSGDMNNYILTTSPFSEQADIKSVVINSGVTSIGSYMFYECSSLTSITIPNSVTSIGNDAFSYCSSLKSLSIPKSVTSIGTYVLNNCSSLTSLSVDSNNKAYDSRNNCNAIINTLSNELIAGCKNTVIPNGVTSIGNHAFIGCSGLKSIKIPNGVTAIGEGSFLKCVSLTEIDIPNSVISIGYNAFSSCSSLTSVKLPESITRIDNSVFGYCISLTDIEIPNSVTKISSYAFKNCSSLKSVEIPDSVTSIGDYAFSGCIALNDISVESGNTVYDSRENCNAVIKTSDNELIVGCKNTVIPNSVTGIGSYAFYDCSTLTSMNIPNSVTYIGNSAFFKCISLTSIVIPYSVTTIDCYAFEYCSALSNAELSNGVTEINSFAFYGCDSLTSVEIPKSVTTIGVSAFASCVELSSISVESENAVYDSRDNCNAIINTSDNEIIAGCVNTLIPSSVTSIGASAFEGCRSLKSIKIPYGVTSIGAFAFKDCSTLVSIEIPKSVTSLGTSAFDGCNALASIEISSNVTSIGMFAFRDCSSLASLKIPSSITKIENWAFGNCSSLKAIDIPDSVTSIGTSAFNGCSSIKSVKIGNSVTSIGNWAFGNCSSIKELTMPCSASIYDSDYTFYNCANIEKVTLTKGSGAMWNYTESSYRCTPWYVSRNRIKEISLEDGITNIGSYAFKDSSSLTSIRIPSSVTLIGINAFSYCSKLKKIKLPKGLSTIYDSTFDNCTGLEEVIIPRSIKLISDLAFNNCTKLAKVFYYGNSNEWENIVIQNYNSYLKYAKRYYNYVDCVSNAEHSFKDSVVKATTNADGKIYYACSKCSYKYFKKSISKINTVKLSKTAYTYDGKAKKPSVTVKDANGATLKKGTDYKVSYSDNKLPGSAKVKLTFIGKYKGSVTKSFKIYPKSPKNISIKRKKKDLIVVSWDKDKKSSGYVIQACYDNKFNTKKGTCAEKTTTENKATITVSPKNTIYIRIKTFRTVNKKKYYSGWSKVKKLKL